MKPRPENKPVYLDELIWVPGQEMNSARVADLVGAFGKPREPLGESWLMGDDRAIYDDISNYGIEGVSERDTSIYLEIATTGMCCFGGTVSFADWFVYLASRVLASITMMDEGEFETISMAVVLFSQCVPAERISKYEKTFATILASWIMSPQFWKDSRYLSTGNERAWKDSWGVYGCDPLMAASFFVAWRYVHPDSQRAWLKSILAIEDPGWRAQFIICLVKVTPIFERRDAGFHVLKEIRIEEMWSEAGRLMIFVKPRSEREHWSLIPPENIAALQSAIKEEFTEERLFEWIDQFSAIPELWTQMEVWLDQLQAIFN